jgi:hypothetical protein
MDALRITGPEESVAPASHGPGTLGAGTLVRHLHGLVTYGPTDLEIAAAMSLFGYDAVKWADGQGILAELLSLEFPGQVTLAAAHRWYEEAAAVARHAFAGRPSLLQKLGL